MCACFTTWNCYDILVCIHVLSHGGVNIKTINDANRQLKELARLHGFTTNRNSCYREKNDGILQLIKFEYEQRLSKYELRIGLYSLYGEMQPQWLKPSGWILRYPATALSSCNESDINSLIAQIDILEKDAFPWLESMHTQRDLVDAMCEIELKEHSGILWVDSLKLAPFLASEDYTAADYVISSILQQHTGPEAWTSQSWIEDDYEMYRKRYPGKDLKLIKIHEWISTQDYGAIKSYLQNNYIINSRNFKRT